MRVLTKVFTSYSLQYLRVLTKVFTSYSLQCLRVLIETSTTYSFLAVVTEEPQRGGTSARVLGVVVMLYCIYPLGHLLAWVSAAPTELNPLLSKVYPGFHFGLCPHYTLGYAGVSCLKALIISPNFDALALGYAGVSCLKALVISPYETVGRSLT